MVYKSLGKFLSNTRRTSMTRSPRFTMYTVAQAIELSQPYVARIEAGLQDETIKKWHPKRQWELLMAYRLTEADAYKAAKTFGLDVSIPPRPLVPVASQSRAINIYLLGSAPDWRNEEAVSTYFLGEDFYPNHDLIGLRVLKDHLEPYLPPMSDALIALGDELIEEGCYCAIHVPLQGVHIQRFIAKHGNRLLMQTPVSRNNKHGMSFAPPNSQIVGRVVKRIIDG